MSEQQQIHTQNSQTNQVKKQNTQKSKGEQQMKDHQKQNHADTKSQVSEQQIPEHFYDSDIASVCEKDFMSDNEPPKDIVQERKLLYKEKLLHVFKTIIRVGTGIDKPARYDFINLKHKQVSQQEIKKYPKLGKQQNKNQTQKLQTQSKEKSQNEGKEKQQNSEVKEQAEPLPKEDIYEKIEQKPSNLPLEVQQNLPPFYSTSYVEGEPQTQYNIGNEHEDIERLVTSMKRGETALFEMQHLVVSKKSNIKIKSKTQIHVIQVFDWTTVIDLDGDKKLLKYVLTKGEGAFRVALYDKITFNFQIQRNNVQVQQKSFEERRLQKQLIEEELPNTVWRVLTSMKDKQSVKLQILDEDFKQSQGEEYYSQLQKSYNDKNQGNNKNDANNSQTVSTNPKTWKLTITITDLIKVDDVHLDGRLLKQTLVRGVSTAKPQSSSLIYYALKFIDLKENQLKKDQCFDSDWWEDYGKLQQLPGIRKNYLDDYAVSKMLRKAIKRMKPAETALVQCRDKTLFTYGTDYQEIKQLLNFTDQSVPQVVKIIIRVYNFTEAKNAFNMEIQQKIIESKRKKQIALKLLSEGRIQKALKKFQNIVAFYSSQKINQQAYDQKVSALMNAILCLMKLQKYQQMLKLCNEILLRPRHGHQSKDIKLVGPGHAKVQGSLKKMQLQQGEQAPTTEGDSRRIASDLVQNQKILDKCLYRKAFALYQMGECAQTIKCLDDISENMKSTDEVKKLHKDATVGKQKYEEKSKKIFKSMFG